MFNKKGDFEARSWPGFVLGVLIFIMGLFPLLKRFDVIGFDLPYTPAGLILAIILSLGGIYLIVNGIIEDHEDFMRWTSIIVGLVTLVLGVVPLLSYFNINITIAFLAFLYSPYLYVIIGLLLMIGAFLM